MSDKDIYQNPSKKRPQKNIELVMEFIVTFQYVKVAFMMQIE